MSIQQYAQHHRFTVDEFHRMAETGILAPDSRVELIDGELIEMTPMGPRHARIMRGIGKWLDGLVGGYAIVSTQTPVTLPSGEPYPDVTVARGPEARYDAAHPTPADVLLLVEVSDSTALFDRNVKSASYARAGIAELWVVDLQHDSVVVFHTPRAGRFEEVSEHRRGKTFVSPALGGREVRVEDVLGPPAAER